MRNLNWANQFRGKVFRLYYKVILKCSRDNKCVNEMDDPHFLSCTVKFISEWKCKNAWRLLSLQNTKLTLQWLHEWINTLKVKKLFFSWPFFLNDLSCCSLIKIFICVYTKSLYTLHFQVIIQYLKNLYLLPQMLLTHTVLIKE